MRRSLLVAFAVVASVLVMSAPPVQAQNVSGDLAVASKHTTASDFQNATLTNTSVTGSGDDSAVRLGLDTIYNPVDDEGDGSAPGTINFVGDDIGDDTFTGEVKIVPDNSGKITSLSPNIGDTAGSDYGFVVDIYLVQEGPDTTSGEGTLIKDGWDPSFSTGEQSIDLDTTPTVTAGTTYTIEFVTQSTDGDGSGDHLEIKQNNDPDTAWYSSGGFTRKMYADLGVNIETSPSNGEYIGPIHTAEQVEVCTANLTLTNVSAAVACQSDPDDDGTFENITTTTYTTTGNKTIDVSGTSDDEWRIRVDFERTGTDATGKLHDETVLFDASAPSGSDAEPTGQTANYDGNISLDVSDTDFGLAQGDSVTVMATNASGGQIGQTTISSNQTITFPYTPPPGQSDVTWTLTDSYGESTTVDQTFAIPSEVEIRNESDPSELVTLPNGTVEVRFYFDVGGDPVIVTRNASDGTVNMTGLPADRPFTIVVDGGDKYVSRRIFVESLYETQTVYLLPENQTHVPTIFEVADYSGQYDQDESALLVQRAFNGSWGTVQGDLIGANERISTQLRVDARHRLVIVNAVTGDRRVLGPYTPVASGTQQVEITSDDQVSISGLDTQVLVQPDIGLLAARSTDVTGVVRSQDATIDNKTLTAEYTAADGSTTTLASTTTGGGGEITSTVDLSGRANGTLTVQVTYNTTAGTMGSATRTYTIRPATTTQYSLLSVLGTIPSYFPGEASVSAFEMAISLLLTLVLTAAAASRLPIPTEVVATLALVQLGGWAVLGWLPYTIPFAAGVTAVGLAAIRRGL